VALDDFGTGYSSLSYLAALPADTIKLDRSFVNREFANASAIIDSVIEMAHRIGLRVVAEGVETSTQSQRLLDLNCDE
jgi:EAL domain-containing protein (putative c-di-GMP-specific phosphodiesterase class I)